MNPELFPPDAGQQLSPRRQWMKQVGVECVCDHELPIDERWCAWSIEEKRIAVLTNGKWVIGRGVCMDDALAELAQKLGLRLWNEEAK
jgi:hypothetical protein